jgi:serine/threonine protein kinase/predicted Zn-dependent protease
LAASAISRLITPACVSAHAFTIIHDIVRFLTPVSEKLVCPGCERTISRQHSYGGACIRCLLSPAFEPAETGWSEESSDFDPYKVLTHPDGSPIEIGRGAMGIAYRAIDVNLQFPVALKVINFKVAGREANWERFVREARAAARIRHPHVVKVLHYGIAADGRCFHTMELVEGETLAERVLRRGPMPAADALEVIAQVASALEAAEGQRLVHRDLKPSNLMLVDGPGIDVKVIDFGLAKVLTDRETNEEITQSGFVGTPAFASPEQVAGSEVDQRSDYFSLGSTFFYLLTGKPPLEATKTDAPAERLSSQKLVIRRLEEARIPLPVRELVRQLLMPALEERPQDGKALLAAIAKCREKLAKPWANRKVRSMVAAVIVLASLLCLGGTLLSLYSRSQKEDLEAKSIAVLPFDTRGLDNEKRSSLFSAGVYDGIITNLAKIADLRVIDQESVQNYRNREDRPPPQQIGKTLHVRYILSGSVQSEGDRVRLTVQLVEAGSGREVWAERYDGQTKDVFSIQAELAETLLQELRARFSSAEKATVEAIPTRNLAAYELYLHAKEVMANYHEEVQGWDPLYSAERLLEDAVSRDPTFSLAWCQLATVNDDLYWDNADRSEARKAAIENELQQAIKLQPDSGETHLAVGNHLLVTTNDYPAIRRELEAARRKLPNASVLFRTLAAVECYQGQWADALKDIDQAIACNPKQVRLLSFRCDFYADHRQYRELHRLYDELAESGLASPGITFEKALVNIRETGDVSMLRALLDEPNTSLHDVRPATFLKIYCALSERDYFTAEKILNADSNQEFEADEKKFFSRDFLLGGIKRAEGDFATAKIAYANARPLQLNYVRQWPDDPNPLMVLAITDAALGRKEDALQEAHQALASPFSQDAVHRPVLAVDLAQVYLWVGERELAMKQLEDLQAVPRALDYGELAHLPEWDDLRNEPRFQKLLSNLNPIPIKNVETP